MPAVERHPPFPDMPNVFKRFATLSERFQWGLFALSFPVVYIIGEHINWKSKPDSRKRMMLHHLVFWPIALLGLKTMHFSFRNHPSGWKWDQKWFYRAGALTGAAIITSGFKLGDWVAKTFVPKKPSPVSFQKTQKLYVSPVFPPSQLNCPFRHPVSPIRQDSVKAIPPFRQAMYSTGMRPY